jgi:hypothetical protein
MIRDTETIQLLCAKLKSLGYAADSMVRIYGEEFLVISNPFPEGEGFAVEAKPKKSASTRKLRIPLPIVQMALPPKHRPAA